MPFDLSKDWRGYIGKNAHVSQTCRLSTSDERILLTLLRREAGGRLRYLAAVERRAGLDEAEAARERRMAEKRERAAAAGGAAAAAAAVLSAKQSALAEEEVVEFVCTARGMGIGYRNSPNADDRFDLPGHYGVQPGEVVYPTRAVSDEENWIPVEFPGHGLKWLPIKLETVPGQVLFRKRESEAQIKARLAEEAKKRRETANELLFTGFDLETCVGALEMCGDSVQHASSWLADRMAKQASAKKEIKKWKEANEERKAKERASSSASGSASSSDGVFLTDTGSPCKPGGGAIRGCVLFARACSYCSCCWYLCWCCR